MWEWTSCIESKIGFVVTATEFDDSEPPEALQMISFDVHRDRFNESEIVKTLQAKIDALSAKITSETDRLSELQSTVDISKGA